MLASTLVRRALRLINVPGRGATLSSTDEGFAFETLQEMLDSESVSKYFQPGIRTHFFSLPADVDIYTYGPGGDFDTNMFEDPAPVRIEDAYIRLGSTIRNNELITADLFNTAIGWTTGAGWAVVNGEGQATASLAALSQAIITEVGQTYRVRLVDVEVTSGVVELTVDGLTQVINASGDYEFTYTATVTNPTFALTGTTSFTGSIGAVSVRDVRRTERTDLIGRGSDYQVNVVDQQHYNNRFSKGTGGRPYELLYSRKHPLGEIFFDNAPTAGDKLIMDVTVNRIGLEKITDTIRMHDEAIRFLRYQLAYEMAPEYGKVLSPSALRVLNRSRQQLAAGNARPNNLRVDAGLRNRRSFDINRGDP